MIIPVRCFSCGKPVGHLWEEFERECKRKKADKVLDDLGLERQCCRALFLGHVEMSGVLAKFRK